MIAWRQSLDLVCRTRGTCLVWWRFGADGRCFGGTCARGCGGNECQWLVRPTLKRLARGTDPPDRPTDPQIKPELKPEPLPLPEPEPESENEF